MSSTVSMHLRDLMVKRVFQADLSTDDSLPDSLWACLTWDIPPSNSFGTFLNEPFLGGYTRIEISLGSASWRASGYGEVLNADVVLFPTCTLDWGILYGWALTDSPDIGEGETYAVGSLQSPIRVVTGMQMAIPPGGIDIGLFD